MPEIRPILFAERYFVSDEGDVFSEVWGSRRKLKPWLNNKGYAVLNIAGVRMLVHRIVNVTFNGPPNDPNLESRHKDGDNRNNRADNLEWGTHAENMQDMVRHGSQGARRHPERMPRGERHGSRTKPHRTPRGERNAKAKIGEADVRRFRSTYAETKNISEAARRCGIPRGAAKCIAQGKTWKHVKENEHV